MNKQKFNTMDNVCLNVSNKGVNSIILLKFCKESDGIFIPPDPAIRLQSEASKL